MSRPTWTQEEQRLREILRTGSEDATPRPDGWAQIAERVGHDDLAGQRERRRRRRQEIAAAIVATSMVAATVVFAVGGGLHRDPAPVAPTGPSSSPTTGFQPTSPRTTWTIYRAGRDRLYSDQVRAVAPYDPAQAFAALFSRPSSTAGPLGLEAEGGNRVASLRSTSTAIVLDLDAADTAAGRRDARSADLEAQAWVHTANAAYNGSDLPLMVTLHGKPLTLFGLVDTARPIAARDVRTVETPRLFLPEVGARVTSPVDIVADPGAGDYDYVVRDASTGKQVWSQTAGQQDSSGTLGFTADLPPGSYEIVVRPAPDRPEGSRRVLFETNFTVTGPAPAPTHTPVSNPPVTDVARVPVTWPERGGTQLVQEWRPRASVAQVLADLAAGPEQVKTPVVLPWRGTTLTSVTRLGDRVVVDLPTAPELRAPDVSTARRWALTLVAAVDGVLQTDLPVQITVAGRPTELFGRLDTSTTLSRTDVKISRPQQDLFRPAEGHWGTGEAVVVGVGEARNSSVTWYVIDPVSNQTLYQGRQPLDDQHTYGFRLPLPAGEYLFEIHLDGGPERTTIYDLRVL